MRLLFPAIFIILSIGLFFFIVDPLYGDVNALRADVDTYNVALSHAKDLKSTRDQLEKTYNDIKPEDKDKLNHFLPNTVNNIELILEIEQLANAHAMPLKDIKFEAPKKADPQAKGTVAIAANDPTANRPYGVFPLSFSTEGNYDTFVSFLKDVEHNLRLVDIKSISFTVPPPPANGKIDPNAADPNSYSYTLKVETYWLK